jgi:uncharacterized membrane protein
MGVLAGIIALVLALIAISRLNRLQREVEKLRDKLWLLEKLGPAAGEAKPPTPISESPIMRSRAPAPESPAERPVAPLPSPGLPPPASEPGQVREQFFKKGGILITASPENLPPKPPILGKPPAAEVEEPAAPAGAARDLGSLEVAIGGSWLNRIGIAMLVIGIVFALGYSLTIMGPAGKAALATVTSLGLIAGGVILERHETYKFYGRGLIGGGWAALYATAYAVHELQATRIVESAPAGFALLMLVGAGMIVHSLRYRNEGLTSLAYGLGYAAIFLHSISAYTLAAATLLGVGTIVHLVRRNWYGVALGGVAATYGSILVWYLRQATMTPQVLRLGLAALAVDWAVFLVADFSREPEDDQQRSLAHAVSLLNAFGAAGLSVLAWIKVNHGGGWQPLAILGAAYVVTSVALRRFGRPSIHPVHSLVASLFLAAAAWRGFDRTGATWAWIAEAQALVLIGIWLKDRFHRLLGCALFLAPTAVIVFTQAATRFAKTDGSFGLASFMLTAAACLCFYFTLVRLKSSAASEEERRREEWLRTLFSFAAFALILLAFLVQLPEVYVAPAGSLLMLLLFELGGARREENLRTQSYLAALFAALASVALSAPSHAVLGGGSARLPALLLVAIAYFVMFVRLRRPLERFKEYEPSLRPVFSWVGTGLITLLVWLEARPVMAGPAWMILALLLVEVGIAFAEPHLRRPGYVVLMGSLVSLVMSNLTATERVLGWPIRVVTVVPGVAATYYLWWRLRSLSGSGADPRAGDLDEKMGRLLSYLGAALVGLFVRFQFGLEGAALRWSLAMVALFLLGDWLEDADFRLQAFALGAAVFVRAVGFDFQSADPVLGIDGPLAITLVGVACFLLAGWLARRRIARSAEAPGEGRRTLELEATLSAKGQDLLWGLAVALAAVYLYRTLSGFMLIVAWAVEGFFTTAGGFVYRTRPLRLAGLALLAVCLLMTVQRAFTTFDTLGRIASFLVLGVVLLLISFGYTRYRDVIRKAF